MTQATIFKANITHNDIYLYADFGEFNSNPNMPLVSFRDNIMQDVAKAATRYYTTRMVHDVEGRVHDAIVELYDIFDEIVSDAIAAGTWKNADQLYDTETWRVVNFANAVRNR